MLWADAARGTATLATQIENRLMIRTPCRTLRFERPGDRSAASFFIAAFRPQTLEIDGKNSNGVRVR
jgi:hypothetical protein